MREIIGKKVIYRGNTEKLFQGLEAEADLIDYVKREGVFFVQDIVSKWQSDNIEITCHLGDSEHSLFVEIDDLKFLDEI